MLSTFILESMNQRMINPYSNRWCQNDGRQGTRIMSTIILKFDYIYVAISALLVSSLSYSLDFFRLPLTHGRVTFQVGYLAKGGQQQRKKGDAQAWERINQDHSTLTRSRGGSQTTVEWVLGKSWKSNMSAKLFHDKLELGASTNRFQDGFGNKY